MSDNRGRNQSNRTDKHNRARVPLDGSLTVVKDDGRVPRSQTFAPERGQSQRRSRGILVAVDTPSGIRKYRYVDDPREVPEGVSLVVGPKGGLKYDPETQEFLQDQFDNTLESLEEAPGEEYTQEQIEESVQAIQDHHVHNEEMFGTMYDAIEEADERMERDLTTHFASHRVKGLGSVLDKVHGNRRDVDDDEYETPDELTDIHGSLAVFDSLGEARAVQDTLVDMVEESDDLSVEKTKDHADDRSNAYRAQHVIIEFEDGVYTEVQLKGEKFAAIADVSHSLCYKPYNTFNDEELIAEMDTLDEPIERGDEITDEIEDCLTEFADYHQGFIEARDDIDCGEQSLRVIQEFMEIEELDEF